MSVRAARLFTTLYFVLFTVAVIWPGYVPFNRLDPRIFGMPFSMAWPAAWLLGAAPMLYFLDRAEARHRESQPPGGDASAPGHNAPPLGAEGVGPASGEPSSNGPEA